VSNQLTEPLGKVLDRAPRDWAGLIDAWRRSDAGHRTLAHVAERQAEGVTIYPAALLRALELTPLAKVRVVILGQDPYHGPDQAEGLAFSVPRGLPLQPSVRNIYKEMARDLGVPMASHGHLSAWARRGVLLLNAFLTVERGKPKSHRKIGWDALTDEIIKAVASHAAPKVFMLWGGDAQETRSLTQGAGQHLTLLASHPSPLSVRQGSSPFEGCGHFSKANRFFAAAGLPAIDWSLG
jgi:uracil-DNA glycosylase